MKDCICYVIRDDGRPFIAHHLKQTGGSWQQQEQPYERPERAADERFRVGLCKNLIGENMVWLTDYAPRYLKTAVFTQCYGFTQLTRRPIPLVEAWDLFQSHGRML